MKILPKLWKNFKLQPDIWFFCGFILTLTLSVRKIFYFIPLGGQFNEYASISFYLSDIFILSTLFSWIILLLHHKCLIMSSYTYFIHTLFSQKMWITCWKWLKTRVFENKLILIPLLLVIWSFFSIIWSSVKIIAIYRSIKLLEFFFLYIYIIYKMFHACQNQNCSIPDSYSKNVPRGTFHRLRPWDTIISKIIPIIIYIGLFEAIIGIGQFVLQHSVKLFWLKESIISPNSPGVAKIIFNSHKFIRAYGLFPHPNILGGYLVMSIIFTTFHNKLFHDCLIKNVPRGTFWYIALVIQLIALILTFSKSAILGLIFGLFYIFYKKRKIISESNIKMFHLPSGQASVEHSAESKNVPRGTFLGLGIVAIIIIALGMIFFNPDLNSLLIKSLNERSLYLNISIKSFLANPIFGLGIGQFVPQMEHFSTTILQSWQYQPVHNVFLLILSELGIIGLFLFIWFLLEIFDIGRIKKCSTWNIQSQLDKRGTFSESVEKNFSDSIKTEYYQATYSALKQGAMREVGDSPNCKYISQHINNSMSSCNVPRLFSINLNIYLKGILLGFIFIMLFDHYFWDIQQGQIMLWMTIGIVAGLNIDSKVIKNKRGQSEINSDYP